MYKKIDNYDLWIQYQREKDETKKASIKNLLIEIYYPLVQKIAYKLAERIGWKLTPEELTSLGIDGLYIAINNFSLKKKTKFATYASRRIYGSMLDEIRRNDIVPRSVRIYHKKIQRIKDVLESEKGRIDENYILNKLQIDKKEYYRNNKKFHPVLFTSIEGSGITNQEDYDNYQQDSNCSIMDRNTPSPDSKLIRKEFFNKLLSNGFSSIEQKIIYYYYYKNMTMDKISTIIGLSESRISQIHNDSLLKLKDKIRRNPKYFSNDICKVIQKCNSKNSIF